MRDAEANGYKRNEYGEYKRRGYPWLFTIDENQFFFLGGLSAV